MTPREWDAISYQRVSVPHEEWARSILDRLELRGDEVVLDAGCGSGRVTSMLIERLPEGRVVAVDGSASMVEQVRSVLRPQDEAMVADLVELELEEPVDVVFSSAVFHWVLDHDALFRSLHRALKPGGRLAAQNGGAGNIERLKKSSAEVASREPYAPHFEGFGQPWNYAAPEETEERLRRVRRGALLAAALGRRPARAGRVPAHGLPRPAHGPPARGAARPLHRRRPSARRRAPRPQLRPPQHRRHHLTPRRGRS
jgi:trans-aconitate 2-methyltransferase